jgi:CDP-glucose 4,6-dehydratase
MGRKPRPLEDLGMTVDFWRDRPVLLTGATGLLGGWLAHRLHDAGADLVCLVRDWVPQSELVRTRLIEQVKVVRGDVRDLAVVERTLGEYEIETVIHLAAQTIVGIANANPTTTLETNIMGTWVILEACRQHGKVRQILVASSDKAYGEQEHLPYGEEMALQGRHPYDVSKSCADLLALAFAHSYGLPVGITRCANLYGGGDLNWNRLVPGTIRAVLRGQRPVIRSDGSYIRDYLYVEDAAAACTMLVEALADRPELRGEAFNFSHEAPLSVSEVVARILSLMGSNLQPLILNRASNEIRQQYLATAKARRLLGWSPLYTMEEGLSSTIRWYEQFLGASVDARA